MSASASSRSGATYQQVQGIPRPYALICNLWTFERLEEVLQHEPSQVVCMEMPLEMAWLGQQVGWGGVSVGNLGKANCVSQMVGDSYMVPTCWLCGYRAQKMSNDLCQYFCLGEICPSGSGPGPKDGQFSSSPFVPVIFQAAAPALELRVSKSE